MSENRKQYTSSQLAWNRFPRKSGRNTLYEDGLRAGYSYALQDIASGRIQWPVRERATAPEGERSEVPSEGRTDSPKARDGERSEAGAPK